MKLIDTVSMVILLIGGVNWGLIGAFDFNLVTWLFGMATLLMKIVYVLIGLSALWQLFQWKEIQKRCPRKRS